jgi:hypothetical protein
MIGSPPIFWLVSIVIIYCGLLILTLDLWVEPKFDGRTKTRIGISLGIGLIAALVSYYAIFMTFSLGALATLNPPYRYDTVVGGITFRPEFLEIDLHLQNSTDYQYNDLNLLIKSDAPIAQIAQLTNVPGVSFSVYHDAEVKIGINSKGISSSIPISLLATNAGYIFRCEKLPPHSTITIVMAIAEMKWPPVIPNTIKSLDKMASYKNYVVRMSSDFSYYWFGHSDGDVYIDNPSVNAIKITGTFRSLFKPSNVDILVKMGK